MRMRSMIAALGLATIFAVPASAMVLGLTWGTGTSPVTVKYKGANHNVYAGSLKAYTGGTLGNPLPPIDGQYFGEVFCVDFEHTISIPTEYNVEKLTTASLANGGRAAWLYNSYLASAKSSAATATALQLALWDVVTDNGDGLVGGNFRYTGSALTSTQAAGMIAASAGQEGVASYFRGTGTYGQGMIGPVPEPGSFALLGLGLTLAGIGFYRRRG